MDADVGELIGSSPVGRGYAIVSGWDFVNQVFQRVSILIHGRQKQSTRHQETSHTGAPEFHTSGRQLLTGSASRAGRRLLYR